MLICERRAHIDECLREGRNESLGEGGALEGRENAYSPTSNQTVTKTSSILCIAYVNMLLSIISFNIPIYPLFFGVNLWVLPMWQALPIGFLT